MTLQQRRLGAGLTQAQLAERVGANAGAVHKWELRDRVPANYAVSVATVLGCAPAQLRPDVFGPASSEDVDFV